MSLQSPLRDVFSDRLLSRSVTLWVYERRICSGPLTSVLRAMILLRLWRYINPVLTYSWQVFSGHDTWNLDGDGEHMYFICVEDT